MKTKRFVRNFHRYLSIFVSFQLQESLAEGIASLVKDTYGVESIKLRVSKPGALRGAKDVGLIIHR